MILRSIAIRNWRCLIGPIAVGPFAEGLNVLHSPNATGKSTLFEAMRRGLLDGHRITGREVEALRPWGRALAPEVIIEFSHAGVECRVTKGFLENAKAVLEKREDGRYRRVAEGEAADAQTRAILRGNPPGRGPARPENWGLAQALWAPQGNLAIAGFSGNLLADIRISLGAQVTGPEAAPLENSIERAYLELFTPVGKLRSGKDAPLLVQLQKRLAEAIERRDAAEELQRQFEETGRRVEDLRARHRQARLDADEIAETAKKAQAGAESYRALRSQESEHLARSEAAETRYGQLRSHIEAIESARDDLTKAEGELDRLKAELPLRIREVENREIETARAKAELEDARRGRKDVDRARSLAELARQLLEAQGALVKIDKLLGRISTAQKELASRKKERADFLAPDAATLRSVRKELQDRDRAQLQIDAALITLEIVPEKSEALEVLAGEETGRMPLEAGRPTQVKGSPEVAVDWPGVGRLRALGPTGSIDQLRTERDEAQQRLTGLTDRFGTTDIEKLEALSERARAVESAVTDAQTRLDTLLSGRSVEDIRQERTRLWAARKTIVNQHPEWETNTPDAEALARAAEVARNSFIAGVESAEGRWEAAQRALTLTATQRAQLETKLQETQKHIESLRSRISELTKDGLTDSERQEELAKRALEWDAARARLKETQKKLSEFVEDPALALERLERQRQAAEKEAVEVKGQEEKEKGRLEQLAAQGPYSGWARADEEVARLEQRIGEEEARVGAIRLLRSVVSDRRSRALAGVAAPVESAATRTLRRIVGRPFGRLRLDEAFKPVQFVPEVSESPVPLDCMSGGEQEQLYLATRLALADLLAKEERQLVVLDDVLAFTDTGRLARVMRIIEEAAQRLQVLIITCHPERYRGLEHARFLDLEAALVEKGEATGTPLS